MAGIIKLGAAGSLRDYLIKQQGSGIAWSRGPANPFAAKVNASGPYDEVDQWNEWVQEDWQQGVGNVDPEAGGFLYGELESRVPNQLILPPLVRQVDTRDLTNTIADCRYMPDNMAGEVTVGTGGYARVAMKFTTPSSLVYSLPYFWIYAHIDPSVQVTFAIYTDSSGPNTLVGSAQNYTAPESVPGWYWHGKTLAGFGTLSTSTNYWLVVYPADSSESFTMGYGTSGYNTVAKSYNGSAWADISSTYLLYTTQLHHVSATQTNAGSGFFRFNGHLYCFANARVWKYDPTDDQWDLVSALTASGPVTMYSVTGATTWGDKTYFGSGGLTSNDSLTMSTAEAFADAGVDSHFYAKYGPYLYRAYQNDLYYSSDGSSLNWVGPFAVGSDEFTITGMAGMGDSLFVATPEALYRFAPGDVVEGVTTWGSLDDTNGLNMVNFQGALYMTVNGRVASFTQDGRLQDVWIKRDDDVIQGRIGKVWHLCVMNNWLVAYLGGTTTSEKPTLWAYQDGAWHHLATLPTSGVGLFDVGYNDYKCYYDRESQCLWAITPSHITYRMYVPDYALNPYNDGSAYFMPRAWFEQDRYYGGLMLVDKAFDSVTIVGDSLSTNVNVKVYWQDQDSTAWEYLGTIDADSEELRWPISTRPVGRWLKLGLLLQTNDGDETPRVRAVVVKNLPFPNDRYRDTVTIILHSTLEMPDRTVDTYTRAQQLTHIESLIATKGTFIYQDPFGVQYEVAIIDYSMSAPIYDNRGGSNQLDEMEITLVLEQIPDTTYA